MKSRVAILLIAMLVAIASPAPAQTKAPGGTGPEVPRGMTTPLSGPAAAWGTTALGAEAWAKNVNEQGGDHGRKIKVVLKDDGYNPGRAVANVNELKDSVFALVGLLGTAVLNANKDNIADAKLPTIWPYGNPQVFAKQPREKVRTVFMVYPDYGDEGDFLVQQAAKLGGAKKVAIFYQNDDYGKGGLDGVKRGVGKLAGSVALAAEVSYEVADRELSTHALKIKESGAEAIIIYSTATHGAGLIKEMAKAGYRPKIFASFPLGDRHVMFRLLGELWEGAYFVTGAVPGEPEADRVIDIMLKQDSKLKGRESFALAGVVAMMATVEGLKRAGKNLTRDGFIEAMESMKDWTPEKLTAPITWGPSRRRGLNPIRMMRAGKAADTSFTEIGR